MICQIIQLDNGAMLGQETCHGFTCLKAMQRIFRQYTDHKKFYIDLIWLLSADDSHLTSFWLQAFATFVLDICRGKLLDATFWVLKRQVHCNNRFWFFRPCYVPIICERTLFAGDAPNHVRDASSRPVGSRLGQICLATLSKKSSFDLCFSPAHRLTSSVPDKIWCF